MTGDHVPEARDLFWSEEHKLVKNKYMLQPVQAVDKFTGTYLVATKFPGCKLEPHDDNLIIRLLVKEANAALMDRKGNSGFFFEYICSDIMEIRDLCDDKRCQTIGYIGEKDMFIPLLESGVKGIDRIVPIGHTMDFDLIWDGYDLVGELSRCIYKL